MKGSAVHTKRNPLVKKLNLSKNHKSSREKKNFPGLFQMPNVFRPQDDETTALGFLLRNRLHKTRKNAGPRIVVIPSLPAMEENVRINVLPPTREELEELEELEDRGDREDLENLALVLVFGAAILGGVGWYYLSSPQKIEKPGLSW